MSLPLFHCVWWLLTGGVARHPMCHLMMMTMTMTILNDDDDDGDNDGNHNGDDKSD